MITAPADLADAIGTGARPARHALARRCLIGAAAGSGLIYALYLVGVAFLPRRLNVPDLYLFGVLGHNWYIPILYVAAVGALFALATLAWRAAGAAGGDAPGAARLLAWALGPPLLFAILLTLTQPLTSRDLFYYIMGGRVLGAHATNPYLLPPAAFPNDPLFPYSNWGHYTSPYGPLWSLVSAGLTLLAGDDLFWSVYLFKLLALAGYLACGALVWALGRALGRPPLPGTVLWLWNPLVLLEFPGAGHNDVLMLAGLLLGLWLHLTGRFRAALAVLAAAAMVKAVALVIVPLTLWHRLAPLPGWAARAREGARTLWLPALIVVGALAPFWVGPGTLGPVRESDHYYASLAHIARIALEFGLSPLWSGRIVRGAILLALLGGYATIVRRAPGDGAALLTAAARATILLLALWTFFVPWYCAWAVAIVAALGARRLGGQILVLCAGATLSYLLQFYLPARTPVSIEFRSALSALLIFGPFGLSLLPWRSPPRHAGARPAG